MLAAKNKGPECMELLMTREEVRSSVNSTDKQGSTALDIANAFKSKEAIITILNKWGAQSGRSGSAIIVKSNNNIKF